MLTPLVQILAYLTATFALGLALGWVLWNFGGTKKEKSLLSEKEYWEQRFKQSSIERNLEGDKVAALESERDTLKKRLGAAMAKDAG
ncbi:MAG: hypothetical protein ACSHW1_04050 [Yoonia sp.]|uniref:hypothetical protein n=1 Tax=Yoonia sp. TaxID=2212373 RepID=UPI003EF70805